MSHIAIIKAQIKSLKALQLACKKKGFIWKEDQDHYRWFGHHVGDYPIPNGMTKEDMGKCLHAIEIPGCNYDVGVIKNPMGGKDYKLIWDFWKDGTLKNKLGNDAGKLVSAYEVEQTKLAAKLNNHICREKETDTEYQLEILMNYLPK